MLDLFRVFDGLGQSKIRNFKVSIMDEDIFWFDVAMDKGMLIEDSISITKLFHKEPNFILRKDVLAIVHVFIQIPPIAKLHDDVEVLLTGDLYLLVVD
jgi:hypothetical protein